MNQFLPRVDGSVHRAGAALSLVASPAHADRIKDIGAFEVCGPTSSSAMALWSAWLGRATTPSIMRRRA